MYQFLKLFNLKGLKECSLSDLGQINVICGKNNSGKSTILEAIATANNRAIGKRLESVNADSIYNSSINRTGWGGGTTFLNNEYKRILVDLTKNRIWYSNEKEIFLVELRRRVSEIPGNENKQLPPEVISSLYEGILADKSRTALIPAKRELELEKTIQGADPIIPNGQGILNYLFSAKNQPKGSDKRNIFEKIAAAVSYISGGYNFDVFMQPSNAIILYFAFGESSWIPSRDCGLGLQDLLVIAYYSIVPDNDIILIEEPEIHIHPDMQRKLLSFFREQTSKQYFLTTHSNIFVNNT